MTKPQLKTNDKKDSQKTERLQKILAQAGIASRRKAEQLILEGAVTVNGKMVTELGTKADPTADKIKVNGKMLFIEEGIEPLYIALNKPPGVLCALTDAERRPNIGRYLNKLPVKVNPVGRLGINTEGLLLLTNDGDLLEKLTKHRAIPRTYLIKVRGKLQQKDLLFLKKRYLTKQGVIEFLQFNVNKQLKSKTIIKLKVIESSKADLKDLFNRRGLLVEWIQRICIGNIRMTGLALGEYQFLTRKDFESLLKSEKPKRSQPKAKKRRPVRS